MTSGRNARGNRGAGLGARRSAPRHVAWRGYHGGGSGCAARGLVGRAERAGRPDCLSRRPAVMNAGVRMRELGSAGAPEGFHQKMGARETREWGPGTSQTRAREGCVRFCEDCRRPSRDDVHASRGGGMRAAVVAVRETGEPRACEAQWARPDVKSKGRKTGVARQAHEAVCLNRNKDGNKGRCVIHRTLTATTLERGVASAHLWDVDACAQGGGAGGREVRGRGVGRG